MPGGRRPSARPCWGAGGWRCGWSRSPARGSSAPGPRSGRPWSAAPKRIGEPPFGEPPLVVGATLVDSPRILRPKAATAIPVPHRHAGTASAQPSPLPPMPASPEAGCWTARAGTAAASWRRGRVPTRQWPAGPPCPGPHARTRAFSVNNSGNLWASPWSMSQANSWINASIANRSAGSIASVIASRSRVTMRLRISGWSPLAAPSPGSRPARTPPRGWRVVRLRRNGQRLSAW